MLGQLYEQLSQKQTVIEAQQQRIKELEDHLASQEVLILASQKALIKRLEIVEAQLNGRGQQVVKQKEQKEKKVEVLVEEQVEPLASVKQGDWKLIDKFTTFSALRRYVIANLSQHAGVQNLHVTANDDKKPEAKALVPPSRHKNTVLSLTTLLDGRLASASADKTIKLWNVNTGECELTLSGHTGSVLSLTVLPDGRLVSGSADKTIKFWNVKTGECELTLSGHGDNVLSLIVLPNGRLASASADKTIKFWSVRTGKCKSTLLGHAHWVMSLAVLPDGRLVSCSGDKTIALWNVKTGKCELVLSEHTGSVWSLAVLPDGRLVSCSGDKTIKLWNVNTGACELTLSGHTNWVSGLMVLPDGRLVSASYDKTIKLWNINTGACESTLSGHEGNVLSLTVLSDGRLASSSDDKTIRFWTLSVPILSLTVFLGFQSTLREAYLNFNPQPDGGILILSRPSKEALTQCASALESLCSDLGLRTTVSEQHLQVSGLLEVQRDEVIKLLRAFLANPAPVSHSSSLLGASRSSAPAVTKAEAVIAPGF